MQFRNQLKTQKNVTSKIKKLGLALTVTAAIPYLGACSDNHDNHDDYRDYSEIILGGSTFAEGIVSAPDGTKYIGGLGDGTIYKAERYSTESTALFENPVEGRSIVGLEVSQDGSLLFACDTDTAEAITPNVLVINVEDGTLLAEHALGDIGFCNDLTVSDNDLFVTDSFQQAVFRIPGDALIESNSAEVFFSDPVEWVVNEADEGFGAFGPNGIEAINGKLYVTLYSVGELWEIDIEMGTGTELELDGTLGYPDGLFMESNNSLLAIANNDVTRIDLAQSPARVEQLGLFNATDSLTTLTVMDGFVFLPVSQFEHIFPQISPAEGDELESPHYVKVIKLP